MLQWDGLNREVRYHTIVKNHMAAECRTAENGTGGETLGVGGETTESAEIRGVGRADAV